MTPDDKNKLLYRLGFVNDTPNIIYCIVAGEEKTGRILGYVGNIPGKKVDWETGKVEKLQDGEEPYPGEDPLQTIIRNTFGERWVRWPIIQNLKPLSIDRSVVRDTEEQDAIRADRKAKGQDEKITLDDLIKSTTVVRYGLYETIIRPTKHRDFDTVDGVRFSVNSLTTLHVKDASIAYVTYPDNLLQIASQIIGSHISSTILSKGYEEYKKRSNELKKTELDELDVLLGQLGLCATSCVMTDPELNREIQAAMETVFRAEQEANADRARGKGTGDRKFFELEGEARGIKEIAAANARRIGSLVDTFVDGEGALNRADAILEATDLIVRQDTATAVGKLRGTLATGANPGLSILSWNGRGGEDELDEEVQGVDPAELAKPSEQDQAVDQQVPAAPKIAGGRGRGRRGRNRQR